MNLTQIPDSRKEYKYFAFISYSSKDIAWGRYLQKKLEHYRLPARLASKRKDSPNRAYPVFRDETDLSGFKVRDALERELEDSRYLIVICSPNSARSTWVNDEIQYFIDRGWEDRILPFIVGGSPYAENPDIECFPPALRNMTNDPLGVDVTALGKRKAFLRLVSALLDVKFDELLQRDAGRRIRNGILLGLLALIATAALVFGIWYNTEQVKYYNAVTYQYEIPVGLYPLTKEEYAGAADTYRITTLRGKVIRLENVNSQGVAKNPNFTMPWTDYPIVEYLYDDNGELITVIQKDETGKEVFRKELTVNKQTREIAIDFHSPNNSLNAMALSADISFSVIKDQDSSTRSEITRHRNTYDENGYLIRTLYQRDNLGTPTCDSNGGYGKAYQYDSMGQITQIAFLDEQGQVFNCKYGYAYEQFDYDDRGNMIFTSVADASGNRIRDNEGVAALQIQYDRFDNALQNTMLDEAGEILDDRPVHTFTYDERGFLTSYQFTHPDGSPAHDEDGIYRHRILLDDLGRNCGEEYLDAQDQPFYSPQLSCASYRLTLDKAGRVLSLIYYDAQGNPTCNLERGTYGVQYAYDENGYLYQATYLDAQGAPTMCKSGYATWVATLDSDGRALKDMYLDAQGNPVAGYTNVAIAESEYDTFGNCIRRQVYDETGKPTYHTDGYSSVAYSYEGGNLVSIRFFDADGAPMLCAQYFHEIRYDYDQAGNRIRWSYYGTDGKPIRQKDNYAVMEKEYDRYGNVISNRFYDADMEPVMHTDNLYAATFAYDDRGNLIREEHFSFAPERLSFTVKESAFDDRGNVVSENYYMENGALQDSGNNTARIEFDYDSYDNLLEVRWLDSSNAPKNACSANAENLRRYSYDDLGQQTLIRHMHRDSAGTDTCLWQERFTYDSKGNRILSERLDDSGTLAANDAGYAAVEQAYSSSGYVIAEAYYDENGDPMLKDETAFRYEYVRDPAGKAVELLRYGIDGKLLPESSGLAAQICHTYDARGELVCVRYLNEKGEPFGTEAAPGSRIEYHIDSMGYQTGAVTYNKLGDVISEKDLYVCVNNVQAGSDAEAAGIRNGDFLIAVNGWELFHRDTPSRVHDLLQAYNDPDFYQLVFCRWQNLDEAPYFYAVGLPGYSSGFQFKTEIGNRALIAQMEAAYNHWQENP